MDKQHFYIDLEKLPEELRESLTYVADQYNALVDQVGANADHIDAVLGKTPEEKEEMIGVFGKARHFIRFIHSKRFDGFLLTGQSFMIIYFLKAIGVETEQITRLINTMIIFLEKLAGLPV